MVVRGRADGRSSGDHRCDQGPDDARFALHCASLPPFPVLAVGPARLNGTVGDRVDHLCTSDATPPAPHPYGRGAGAEGLAWQGAEGLALGAGAEGLAWRGGGGPGVALRRRCDVTTCRWLRPPRPSRRRSGSGTPWPGRRRRRGPWPSRTEKPLTGLAPPPSAIEPSAETSSPRRWGCRLDDRVAEVAKPRRIRPASMTLA